MNFRSRHLLNTKMSGNPYFRAISEKTQTRLWAMIGLCLAAILIVLIFRFFPGFWVYEVRVKDGMSDAEKIETQNISDNWVQGYNYIIPRRSKLFIDTEKLKAKLELEFTEYTFALKIENAILDVFPEKRQVAYYVLKNDSLYALAKDGSVLRILEDLERVRTIMELKERRMTIISDEREGDGLEGKMFGEVLKIFETLGDKTLLTPVDVRIDVSGTRVDFETKEGPTVYLSLEKPLDSQIDKLASFLNKKLVELSSLKYIDARFTNRLYYQ